MSHARMPKPFLPHDGNARKRKTLYSSISNLHLFFGELRFFFSLFAVATLQDAELRSVHHFILKLPIARMPKAHDLHHHTTGSKEVTGDDISRALESLHPTLWGFKGKKPYHRARKVPLSAETSNVAAPKDQCPLPTYPAPHGAVGSTSSNSTRTVTVYPPAGIPRSSSNLSESNPSSVVVRRAAAAVSTPSATSSISPSSPPAEGSGSPPNGTKSIELSESTSTTDAASLDNSQHSFQVHERGDSISSHSDGTAYTRMQPVHPTSSTRPQARTNFLTFQRKFIPTSFSAGVRPSKVCLSTTSSFSARSAASPPPSFSQPLQDALSVAPSGLLTTNSGTNTHSAEKTAPDARGETSHSVSPSVDESGVTEVVDTASQGTLPDAEVEQSSETALSTPSGTTIASHQPFPVEGDAMSETNAVRQLPAGNTEASLPSPSPSFILPKPAQVVDVPSPNGPSLRPTIPTAGVAETKLCGQPAGAMSAAPLAQRRLSDSARLESMAPNAERPAAPAMRVSVPSPSLTPVSPGHVEDGVQSKVIELTSAASATSDPPRATLTRRSLCRVPKQHSHKQNDEPMVTASSVSPPLATALASTPALPSAAPRLSAALKDSPSPPRSEPEPACQAAAAAGSDTTLAVAEDAPVGERLPQISPLLRLVAFEMQKATPVVAATPPLTPSPLVAKPQIPQRPTFDAVESAVAARTVTATPTPLPSSPAPVAKSPQQTLCMTSLAAASYVSRSGTQPLLASPKNSPFIRLAAMERFY